MTDNGDPAQQSPEQWSYDHAHVPPAGATGGSAGPEHSADQGDGPIFGTTRTGAIPPVGPPGREDTADASPYDQAQYGAPVYGTPPHEAGEFTEEAPEAQGRHSQFDSDGFPDVHYYARPGVDPSVPGGSSEPDDAAGGPPPAGADVAAGPDELSGSVAGGPEQSHDVPPGSYPSGEFGTPFGLPPAPFYADAGQHAQGQPAAGQHAQYDQNQHDQNPQAQNQYDQNQWAQNQYAQAQYDQAQYDQSQWAQSQYDQNPADRDQFGRNQYDRTQQARDPFARDPQARDPQARDQYAGAEPSPADQQRYEAQPNQIPAWGSPAHQPAQQPGQPESAQQYQAQPQSAQQQPAQQQPGQPQPGQAQQQQPQQQPSRPQPAQQQPGQAQPDQPQNSSQPSSYGTPAPAPDASRPRGPLPTASQPRPESLLVPSHRATATQAAQFGWQGRIRRLTAGAIKPQPSAQELADRKDRQDIQRTFSRPMTIVVVQPKGGAGKTPATIGLASALGAHRGGYVVGWDDNETRGTLAVRVDNADKQTTTVWDLLSDLGTFERTNARVGDLSHYVRSQGAAQFDALVSDDSPGNMAQIGESEFKRIHTVLQRFYRQIVVDTGNNVRSPNWQAAVNSADQIVVVSTYQRDVGYSGSWVLDHLIETGRAELAAGAITVLSAADPHPDPAVRRELIDHFGARTRVVVEIPYDPLIALGGPIEWVRLKPETRRAWTHAGASVVTALAAQDEAERLASRTSG